LPARRHCPSVILSATQPQHNSQDVVPFFGAVLPLGRENVIDVGATWQKKEKIDRCGVWVSETKKMGFFVFWATAMTIEACSYD
jgi:hypothetical protein